MVFNLHGNLWNKLTLKVEDLLKVLCLVEVKISDCKQKIWHTNLTWDQSQNPPSPVVQSQATHSFLYIKYKIILPYSQLLH
jgi:hypothetical protein